MMPAEIRRRTALLVSAVLVGSILQATAAPVAEADDLPEVSAAEKPLTGHGVTPKPRASDGEPRVPKTKPNHSWAKAGSATVSLHPGAKTATVRAGSLPVSLITPKTTAHTSAAKSKKTSRTPLSGRATVRVLDQKTTQRAGVDGLLFSVQRQPKAEGDAVGVSLDYSAFAQAYGAGYAARMKLVQLPACAATHPGTKKCSAATPVRAHNDTASKTLTATTLTLPASSSASAAPMLLAATAGDSSDHGDFKASQLSPSATWQTNLNTGDFS
jgi:hypothetical protein